MSGGLQVERAGPLTTVQDLGRPGLAHLGVTTSGACDRGGLRLANRLVGNPEGAAGLEVTVGGLQLRATAPVLLAVTGADCPVSIDGGPVPLGAPLAVGRGQRVRLGAASAGVRAYVAVRGGLAVPPVLGSASTDLLAGLGPSVLADGDRLPVGDRVEGWPLVDVAPVAPPAAGEVLLRAVAGPRDDRLGPDGAAVLGGEGWVVAAGSDRVGLRLQGPAVPQRDAPRRPSEPIVRGAVQLPPSGEPVIFLADHPVTGGYPVVAVVLDADVDLAGQLRPGQPVRLRWVPPPTL